MRHDCTFSRLFAVFDGKDVLRWSTNTAGKGTAPRRFMMQNDGNALIADSRNQATWVSYTSTL
jgi:6-phosphogluconolactonase (cycloisomerase 2 family)